MNAAPRLPRDAELLRILSIITPTPSLTPTVPQVLGFTSQPPSAPPPQLNEAMAKLLIAWELLQHHFKHTDTLYAYKRSSTPIRFLTLLEDTLKLAPEDALALYLALEPYLKMRAEDLPESAARIFSLNGDRAVLGPKTFECAISQCPRAGCSKNLTAGSISHGIYCTLGGPVPCILVSRRCEECNVTYHPTFSERLPRQKSRTEDADYYRSYYKQDPGVPIQYVEAGPSIMISGDFLRVCDHLQAKNW
ncbi:hypothetical protein P7C70_g1482, partial [Phenoliferia sp. Uapishka_3]